VDQIKKHPFFYGVDWNSIRVIEAPFIPRLRSITDTSYFPTDELEQVPEEPAGADTSGAHKDLAFLGYVAVIVGQCTLLIGLPPVTLSNGSLSLQMLSDVALCLPHRRFHVHTCS
jgi:hypothetical protein